MCLNTCDLVQAEGRRRGWMGGVAMTHIGAIFLVWQVGDIGNGIPEHSLNLYLIYYLYS